MSIYRTASDTARCEFCAGSDIHTGTCVTQIGPSLVYTANACLTCGIPFATAVAVIDHVRTAHTAEALRTAALVAALDAAFVLTQSRPKLQARPWPGPCPCECNSGGFCGGCGHAGCAGRR